MAPVATAATAPTKKARNMEDRDCDIRPRVSRSHHRLPKAGTFANARLPRSNSATGGLPRGRSFQNGKPHNPAAQAAQDGYYQRKAAKMYAEKRKAAAAAAAAAASAAAASAAAATKENAPTEEGCKPAGLINITVDHHGVKIDDGNTGGKATGMGSRRNSRSRMSRSSSRRGNGRGEDKENSDRPTEAEIDAFFNRKRGETCNRDTHGENTSWDGSMPKRQHSKSFIERHPRPLDSSNTNPGPVKDVATSRPTEKRAEKSDEHRQRRKRGNKRTDTERVAVSGSEEGTQTVNTSVSVPAETNKQECKQIPQEEENGVPSISDVSETEANSSMPPPPQEPEITPSNPPKDTESQSSGSSYKTSVSKAESTTSEASSSTDAGKWCDECAGIGLHIAALMSDLKKYRPLSECGAEPPTPTSSAKKGWKSMVAQTVLGSSDSKTKINTEKNRLQSEITVLRATVEFLYKRIETLENGGLTSSSGQ